MNFKEWLLLENNFDKKLIDTYGKYKVYMVNGEAVRNSSLEAEEFGGSEIHAHLPKVIPEDEIWIEDDVAKEEIDILVASRLYEIKLLKRGVKLNKAYEGKKRNEEKHRKTILMAKHSPEKINNPVPKEAYVKKYGEIKYCNIRIWLVDG